MNNPILRTLLSLIAVPVFGFILLNLTFLIYALFANVYNILLPRDLANAASWLSSAKFILFLALVLLISWFVLKSRLGILPKATFMTVPLAVVFVTLGILLYPWPMAAYSVGLLMAVLIAFYLRSKHLPWLYYYTLALVAITLAVFTALGGEI